MNREPTNEPRQPRLSDQKPDDPEEAALAEARAFNSIPDDELSLEGQIRRKFAGMTTGRLIQRMERAEDFRYDDEARELSRRLREKRQTWKWSESFTHPQVIICDAGEGEA